MKIQKTTVRPISVHIGNDDLKKSMRVGIRTFLPHEFYLWKVADFIKHFLISASLYEESTLTNLSFLIKEDFLYVVLIFDFTGLKESRKGDAITSILRTIQNPIKFELHLRFRPNLRFN